MDQTNEDPADGLRSVDELLLPDARMHHFSLCEAGTYRSLTQKDRHASISMLSLDASVPEDIRVHFDTARNAYLYAWFVYRFHVVAEQHALSTLELALRTVLARRGIIDDAQSAVLGRGSDQSAVKSNRRREASGLRQLLDIAAKHKIIVNEKLPLREQWALDMASRRISLEQINYMREHGLDELVVQVETPVPTEAELNFDWIGRYCEVLPQIRNIYAHGSTNLHASVLRTFEVVWSLVNQMFVGDEHLMRMIPQEDKTK